MTCVVGMAYGGKVYLGADRQGTLQDSKSIRAEPKIFKKGNAIFGCSNSFRRLDILKYKLKFPKKQKKYKSVEEFLIRRVIPLMQDCLSGEEEIYGHTLIGMKGQLFVVENNFQVLRFIDDFWAIGSGRDLAFGAYYLLKNKDMAPQKKIKKMLEAAAAYNVTVSPPFDYLEV